MEYHTEGVLCSLPINQEICIWLAGMECMLYCDHRWLSPFFTTGMFSPMLDIWALELPEFSIKFQHIQGKWNVVVDVISQWRTLGPYQDSDNKDIPLTIGDVIKNIIEEVHIAEVIQKTPIYNVQKLNLDILWKEQQCDWFCKNKVKEMNTKPDLNFLLDENSIFRKVVKLKYTVEPTIIVPRKLTSLIILGFHNTKGHQGINCTVKMMRHYFWWIDMWRDIHQHINSCK